jgi:hypothetical protein
MAADGVVKNAGGEAVHRASAEARGEQFLG